MTTRSDGDRVARRAELRQELYRLVEQGQLGVVDAVRRMRKIADKTQAEYAKLVGISPRVLIDFERGVGNPTLRSIEKMLRPFGLEISVRRRRSDLGPAGGARGRRASASGGDR
jgi:transcriptional regulator with XRE-family HTH domain